MPDPVAVTDRRESRLLPVLFWTGVAFAPVAALILLVADGNGPLRFAAVLAITAVVLIGLSIALRTDGGGSRAEIEALYDDIEELRRELHGEIVATAQRGNQALDASQRAQDQVAALRRRLDAVATAAAPEPPAERSAGTGRARVPLAEVYDDARRPQDIDEAPSGRVRVPGMAHDDEPPVRRPRPTPRSGAERPAQPGGPGPAPRPAEPDARSSGPGAPEPAPRPVAPEPAARPVAPEPAPRPVGMVRHTETVHVTTRHTVVDGPEPGVGLYGAGPAGRWPSTPQERPWASAVVPEPEDHWAGHADSSARVRPEPPDDRSRPPQPTERHAPGRSAARAAPAWPVPGEEPAWPVSRDEPGRAALRGEALRGVAARDGAAWAGRPDDAGGAGQYGVAGRVGRYDHADRSDHRDGRGPADEPDWGSPADGSEWGRPADEPGWGGHVDEPGRGGRADESGGIRAGVPDGARPADRGSWDAPGWSAAAGRARPYQPEPAPAGPGQWSELRAGDRWAEVHDDERGREVRVGERRATAHADADGSGYRVEDRWASVRRSEPRAGQSQGERRWDEDPGGRRPDPDQTGRHQHADGEWSGHPPRDDPPRAGGTR
ncbi:hypothetical protein [Micromonospora sp. CA-111912]|uniref:hypothetical protein n=1 Tax=Micromonospora sp. CA-111912 TaxID=3239955 RepID=UPI003D8C5EB2